MFPGGFDRPWKDYFNLLSISTSSWRANLFKFPLRHGDCACNRTVSFNWMELDNNAVLYLVEMGTKFNKGFFYHSESNMDSQTDCMPIEASKYIYFPKNMAVYQEQQFYSLEWRNFFSHWKRPAALRFIVNFVLANSITHTYVWYIKELWLIISLSRVAARRNLQWKRQTIHQ